MHTVLSPAAFTFTKLKLLQKSCCKYPQFSKQGKQVKPLLHQIRKGKSSTPTTVSPSKASSNPQPQLPFNLAIHLSQKYILFQSIRNTTEQVALPQSSLRSISQLIYRLDRSQVCVFFQSQI